MKKSRLIVLLMMVVGILPSLKVAAQQIPQLPIDKAVRYGKLPNGLTYYVRANKLPENRVNFYIAQKVGSVQEDDSQQGLAHFLEHMCFNGTDNFPENALIRYCESIGVKFGQNLNAYTSTDETVYNIDDVPVSESNIDSCLLILHDWADGLTLAPAEIDKERGVIHEEWRMRNNASLRMLTRSLPKMYPGSKYAHRMPIGLMEIVDNFKPEALRAYYEKWYRPDLQGIVVVGDIDAAMVENKIKEIFSPIVMPENAAKYEHYPVPDTPKPIYIIEKDKEMDRNIISMMFKHDPLPEEYRNTAAFLGQELVIDLASMAINARLAEMSQKADCPFLGAQVGYGQYLISKTKDAFSVDLAPKTGKDLEAVKAVMNEVERASRFGFNASEIIRVREEMLSGLEKIYNNRDKQTHSFYIQQYVRHFLDGNAIPDFETKYNLYKMMCSQMPTEAYSQVFKELTASLDTNFVFYACYPEKDEVKIPTEAQVKEAVNACRTAELEAYVDNVKNDPLVPVLPQPGKIEKESAADFGYTCWTLANGARVFFKKTDFNDSQILFTAISKGGKSLVDNKDLVNLNLHDAVINAGGAGDFNSLELEKKLAGKQVSCNVALGQATDNLNGSSTPKDLRTLFELIYLTFQEPNDDPDAYNTLINALKAQLENMEKLPDAALSDSITATLYGHNQRVARLHLKDLEKADYNVIKRIYSERFAVGGDFDFYFTGAINEDSLRLFTEQYIAPLKAQKKRETYDLSKTVAPIKKPVDNFFTREMETPQATIVQFWTGDLEYSHKNYCVMNTLGAILTQRYLKSIREDGGMAYSVSAEGNAQFGAGEDSYILQIYCPVKPAKRDSALLLMQQGIEDIAAKGVTLEELDKVKQFELKEHADSQRRNGYWQNLITNKTQWGKDLQKGRVEAINSVTSKDIQNFVNKVLLKDGNRITISMLPADFKE